MSTKHVFSSPDDLVLRGLRGAVALNPTLRLHEPSKSVYVADPSPEARVALIAGGGAGHEPAHASYTGTGMLAASVSGEIFASPSAAQLLTTIELALLSAPHPNTTVLIICNNYTGDRLNFGLALARARAKFPGLKIDIIINSDDVSLLHTDSLLGPRGLGGNILVCKILGAAAAAGHSFEELKQLGKAVVGQLASIGVGLEHCHVPGRSIESMRDAALAENAYEIGMGLHNEPGARKGTVDSPEDLVSEMLDTILQSRSKDFVRVGRDASETDEVVLFINNLGGLSQLEQCAIVDEALTQLQALGIHLRRVYSSAYMTSLNAPGFSFSLLNVSAINRENLSIDIYALLDAPTNALAWVGVRTGWPSIPRSHLREDEQDEAKVKALISGQSVQDRNVEESAIQKPVASYWREIDISTARVEAGIRAACYAVLEVVPELTVFDTIVGDGDCGDTFRAGAKATLRALDDGVLSVKNLNPSQLMQLLGDVCEQSMGGTIGAVLAIFFTSLSPAVPNSGLDESNSWHTAPASALNSLSTHTPARSGDRTLVDALQPFSDVLASSKSLEEAVAAARRGAEKTRGMRPRLGRAAYVGAHELGEKDLPPDPGAWGVAALIEGLYKGMSSLV